MNNFFKTFLASLLALVVFSILPILVLIGISTAVSSIGKTETTVVSSNSILKIDLSQPIVETLSENPMNYFNFNTMKMAAPLELPKAVASILSAASDDRIDAIYIDARRTGMLGVPISSSVLTEVRDALKVFKLSGKRVYFYGIAVTNTAYFLASVADEITLSPVGNLFWLGLSSDVVYYKDLLDGLGVKVNLIKAGKFKSAGEPFISDKMSAANREQTTELLKSIWGYMTDEVSIARNISAEQLNKLADNLEASTPEGALQNKMIDQVAYYDTFIDSLNANYGEDHKHISLSKYANTTLSLRATKEGKPVLTSPNKIALLVAEGTIMEGSSQDGVIGDFDLRTKIISLRQDSSVKAVVLRVNSPGGSAVASEIIWRELMLLKEKKPLVVSMGDYAASGGYYISAPADFIFAEPTTLTGSIGVFSILPEVENSVKMLGLNIEQVSTNKNSSLLSGIYMKGMTPTMKAFFQSSTDTVYSTFKQRVAEGRNLTLEQVEEIAQGRIWAGADAQKAGLVDSMGGVADAVLFAAERAGVKSDFIMVSPASTQNPMTQIFSLLETKINKIITPDLGIAQRDIEMLRSLTEGYQIKTLVPYRITYQ